MSTRLGSSGFHPILQLTFLILTVILGAIVLTIIGLVLYVLTSGNSDGVSAFLNGDITSDINLLRIILVTGNSLGPFILGSIAFALFTGVNPKEYYHLDQSLNWKLMLLVLLILIVSNPLLEWLTQANQKLRLPESFKEFELWMQAKEAEAASLTKTLLKMDNPVHLIINIVIIAVLPAVGEELFFRGGLQNIFAALFKNQHVTIWVTAFIFSAIHLQFYGFIPRMLLGALFGYFLVYGGNLWYAIAAHFINNGSAVLIAYILQKQGQSIEDFENMTSYNTTIYIISAVLTLTLLILFFRIAKKQNTKITYG